MSLGRSGTSTQQVLQNASFSGAWVLNEDYCPGTAKKVVSDKKEDETTRILNNSSVKSEVSDSKQITAEPVKFETIAKVGDNVLVHRAAANTLASSKVSAASPRQSFFSNCCPCWSKPSVDDPKAEANIQLSSGSSKSPKK